MLIKRFGSSKILPLMILIIVIPIIFAPMLLHMIAKRGADYQPHIVFALEMANGTREILPHPLFHLGTLLIYYLLPGISGLQAGFIFALLIYILLSVVIYSFYIRPIWGGRRPLLASAVSIVVTVILMTISSVTILTWGEHNLYTGYVIPNAYHSPTMAVLRPFALLVFIYAAGVFLETRHFQSRIAIIIAAILMVLASLAKPNYTVALLPALGLLVLYRLYRRQFINWRLLILGLGLPAVVVIAIQMLMLRGSSVSGGSIVFAPFELFNVWNANDRLLLKFIMSILFPVAVYGLYLRQASRDSSLNLAWLTFFFGSFYTYFLVESDRISDGNFIWSGQITVFVLFVVSAAFFLRQIYVPGKGFILSRAALICILIGLLHIVSGILWYSTEIRTVTVAERWW